VLIVEDQQLPVEFQALFDQGLVLGAQAQLQQGLEVVVQDLVQVEVRIAIKNYAIDYLQNFFKRTFTFLGALELR
jgi:hypothetical protein